MVFFTDEELDRLIVEDVPYFDMTTRLAKFGSRLARIQFFTTAPTVICCTEEVMHFFRKLNCTITLTTMSGEYIDKEIKFLEVEGLAKHFHTLWRVSSNLLEFASGIATRTREMVDVARKINPNIIITSTRKTIPYTRKITAKAVLVGGGNLNRLSLSENIMFFQNHYKFFGGLNNLAKKIDAMKAEAAGKPISVETISSEDALMLAETAVDIIQVNAIPPKELAGLVIKIKNINPNVKIAAAGGIVPDNVGEYAQTGVDIIVTSYPNHCAPALFRVQIDPLETMSV